MSAKKSTTSWKATGEPLVVNENVPWEIEEELPEAEIEAFLPPRRPSRKAQGGPRDDESGVRVERSRSSAAPPDHGYRP